MATSLVESPPPQDRLPQDAGEQGAGARSPGGEPPGQQPGAVARGRRGLHELRQRDGARAGLVPALRRGRARERRDARLAPWALALAATTVLVARRGRGRAMRRSPKSRSTRAVKTATVAQAPPPAATPPPATTPTPTPPPASTQAAQDRQSAEDPDDGHHAPGDDALHPGDGRQRHRRTENLDDRHRRLGHRSETGPDPARHERRRRPTTPTPTRPPASATRASRSTATPAPAGAPRSTPRRPRGWPRASLIDLKSTQKLAAREAHHDHAGHDRCRSTAPRQTRCRRRSPTRRGCR